MPEADNNSFLCARDICKEYKIGKSVLRVLNKINLEVNEGEILVILGASGAGKSTLLHILGVLDSPTSGYISFRGENLSNAGQKELAKKRSRIFGFVFQFYHLLPDFNALENVLMPSLICQGIFNKKSKKENIERATQLLNHVGLGERINHRPDELSGGEKQRISIVRALMNEPKILLCDEPTGNLDTKTGLKIQDLIWELNERTKLTTIIVSHDESIAKRAGRVIRMADGEIVKL